MSIFNDIDFSQAHDKVTCCILDYLIQGIQQFGQKVIYNYILIYNSYNTFKYFYGCTVATGCKCLLGMIT